MATITEEKVIEFLQEMRAQEMKLEDESIYCREHNYSIEAMLLHEKAEILRKLGNKLLDHFELGWINYSKLK